MSLISFSFILFLPFIVFINFSLPKKQRYVWLFFANLFFYLVNDIRYAIGLVFCVLTTYITGLLLDREEIRRKTFILASCIAANVISLLFFRHSGTKLGFIPLGISFYTLQSIGYLIDIHRKQIPAEKNLLRYAAFISFFPTIISGPIQRGTDLLRQIKEGRDFDYNKAHSGLYLLLWGYLLKLFAANKLDSMVSFAYDNYQSMPGATLLWATALYAVQLYFDFAGYSALAIGTGQILGFDIKNNFFQPYFSVSIKDFWNRWHISLSSWLRDYVYIPLGGNRKGRIRKYLNLFITFLVSGLWHGSGINFLIWGALHGCYQIVGDVINQKKRKTNRLLSIFFTFILVDFAWLFFRASSLEQAVHILYRIIFHFNLKEMSYYGSYLLGGTKLNLLFMLFSICIIFLVDYLHEKNISIEKTAACKLNIIIRWGIYIILTLFLLLTIVRNYGQAASTFIYERF